MDIPQLLDLLVIGEDHEIVEARRPYVALRVWLPPFEIREGWGSPDQFARETMFQHLHNGGRVRALGLGDEQVNVLWHNDVRFDDEAIEAAHVFQHFEEEIATHCIGKKRTALITARCDEVEISRSVIAMKSPWHWSSFTKLPSAESVTNELFRTWFSTGGQCSSNLDPRF